MSKTKIKKIERDVHGLISNVDYIFNEDGMINVIDIVILVDWIISDTSLTDLEITIADMTNDGLVNVLDIVALVNVILNP